MRISDNQRFYTTTRSLTSLAEQHARAARRASTGERLDTPSADPIAAAELVRLQARAEQSASYKKSITYAQGDMQLAEGALAEANDVLAAAHEIALRGANGSLGSAERQSLAQQVQHLQEQLVNLANTKGAAGYVFSGTATDTRAFSPTGTFQGNDAARTSEISDGLVARINVSGAQTFTAAGGRDVFADLEALRAALAANDTAAIGATLDDLQASRDQVGRARGDAGLILDRLTTTHTALEHLDLAMAARQNDLGTADPYTSYSDLVQLSNTLERAVVVAQQTLGSSALKF